MPTPIVVQPNIDLQIKTTQGMLDSLNTRIKALKVPDRRANPVAYAKYEQLIISLRKQRDTQAASLSKLQAQRNQMYADTGQYEKLLTGDNRNAFLALNALFKNYGLESLAGKIYEYIKNGDSADTISILLQDTPEYKARFSGNEARKAAGLPVLSPSEYLATEASYRQIMQSAGLPAGFYDQPSDFSVWIGKNVSPQEIESRVDLATQATVLSNPSYRQALNQLGIDDSHLTAYFLDPNKALPILQKSAATAQIGAEAIRQGLSFDTSYAELLATSGVTRDQAQTGYSQISSELSTMQGLGQIYGEEWNQRTSEEALFQGSGEAIKKKGRLLSQERGTFGATAGGARGGLAQSGGAR